MDELFFGEGMIGIFEFKYKQIGAKIAYYRRLRNLTQKELARRLNISQSSLGKIECGKYNNNVPLSTLLAIAEELNIELVMLVDFDKRETDLEVK